MKQFRVHIFATIRVPVCTMATDQKEAIRNVEKETDLHSLLSHGSLEFAEEITGFLVDEFDEAGELMFERSQYYDKEPP